MAMAILGIIPWIARMLLLLGVVIGGYYIYRTFSTVYKGVEQAAPLAGGAIAVMSAVMMMFPFFMLMFMMMSLMTSLMRMVL